MKLIDERIETFQLSKRLKIVSPWPALLVEEEGGVLVVSDLHLGMEDEQESKGVHIPTTTYPKIMRSVIRPAKALGCRTVILLGDVKHEFGRPKEPEWWATRKLVKSLREFECEPEVVRGNHDNYIISVLNELGVTLHQPSLALGRFVLTHGHIPVGEKVNDIVMGHEHPVLAAKDEVGAKHRFKAFLHGIIEGRHITVLPSVSPLAYGSDINEIPSNDLLSPILRGKNLGNLVPYLLEPEVAVKRFPSIRELSFSQS